MDTFTEIVQKLWRPAQELYREGISYPHYLTELTWLLFLKTMPAYGISSRFNWDVFVSQSGKTQFKYYQKILTTLAKSNDLVMANLFAHACTSFKHPEQLTRVITALMILESVSSEEIGEIYEALLEQCAQEGHRGISITPSSLVDTMVILTQPHDKELIQDPLAGTASFLVASDQYIRTVNEYPFPLYSQITYQMIGVEQDLARQRLALMNCLLHRIGDQQHLPVRWGDSLLINKESWPLADVVFSTLVFEQSEGLGKHDASLALLQHIYQILKPGGRAAVIVPDKVLNSPGPARDVRRLLLDHCVVHTVLRLPQGIFHPLKVSAHVLFLRRSQTPKEMTQDIWFYDARSLLPTFGQHLRLSREYLKEFERVYGENPLGQTPRQENQQWRCFNREDLVNDNLDQCWLQDHGVTHFIPFRDILDTTVEELEELSGFLK